MTIASITALTNIISLAAQAATSPQAQQIYADAKNVFAELFSGGLISVDVQNALMAWADAHMAAVLAGTTPPEFVVS